MATDLEWAQHFASLAGSLHLADRRAIARRVVEEATALTPGCAEAAMCLRDRHGTAVLAAATSESIAAAECTWHEAGDGPCLAAIGGEKTCQISDLPHDGRWAATGSRVAQTARIRAVAALPLIAGDEVLGALTLAGRSAHAFEPTAIALETALATHAALALACAAGRDRNNELAQALRSSRLIGAAVGIVMARRLVTAEQAFDLLRRFSRRGNTKIREIAAGIVATGRLPEE